MLLDNPKAIHFFEKYFNDQLLEPLVRCTNKNAETQRSQSNYTGKWYAVKIQEIRVFFGMCMFMRIVRVLKIKDYWHQNN